MVKIGLCSCTIASMIAVYVLGGAIKAQEIGTNQERLGLEVITMQPAPNYRLTTDPKDALQLVDGELAVRHRLMWVQTAAVGWSRATPITLCLRVAGNGRYSGSLRIHFGVKPKVELSLPRRIDVYSVSHENMQKVQHVTTWLPEKRSGPSGNELWIHIPLADIGSELFLVLHVSNVHLLVDDIRLYGSPKANSYTRSKILSSNIQAVTADSSELLRRDLLMRAEASQRERDDWRRALGSRIVVWTETPWEHLEVVPPLSRIEAGRRQEIEILGSREEREIACVGMLNTSEQPTAVRISVDGSTAISRSASLSRVKPVLAANGQLVFDPLVPLPDDASFELLPGKPQYLWLSFDLRTFLPGSHPFSVVIMTNDDAPYHLLKGTITVRDIRLSPSNPYSVVWAHMQNKPIWNDMHAAIRDLHDHGVNVHIINSKLIPQPSVDGRWDNKKWNELVSTVKHLGEDNYYLLSLEWEPGKKLKSLGVEWLIAEGFREQKRRKLVTEWLHRITQSLRALGIPKSRWALYPMDEPNPRKIDLLKKVAALIKSIDPEVQIYANPVSGGSRDTRTTISDLKPLQGLIDIWQPRLNFVDRTSASFFRQSKAKFWIYDNPQPPAKAASPLHDYRLLFWRAWLLGATGAGFWSYSSAEGSAWDDFDGRRGPDWAVVYEGDTGPVSSRRWEAFRKGIEDYRLLSAVLGEAGERRTERPRSTSLRAELRRILESRPSSIDIERFRRQMLLE